MRSYVSDRRGNVALISAAAILAFAMIFGLAIDGQNAVRAKSSLQNALDAATLAAGARSEVSSATIAADVAAYLAARTEFADAEVVSAGFSGDGAITAEARYLSPNAMGGLFGVQATEVRALTKVVKGGRPAEIVLVLDNTGSMYTNGGDVAVRHAVADLLDVFADAAGVRIGVVPYTAMVNVKGAGYSPTWIDLNGSHPWHGKAFEAPGGAAVNVMDLFDAIPNADWKGCVELHPDDFDNRDDAPTSSDATSRFVPYFFPDEPDHWPETDDWRRLANDYLPDRVAPASSGSPYHVDDLDVLRSTAKYDGSPAAYDPALAPSDDLWRFRDGPNSNCSAPILPLTSDLDAVRAHVAAFEDPYGYGTNHLPGLMWGLRVLSPQEPYAEGAAFGAARKFMIFLTDGELRTGASAHTPNGLYYTGVGYAWEDRLDETDPEAIEAMIVTATANACDEIKAQGITIFSAAFKLGAEGSDIVRDCASSDPLFYDADSAQKLKTAFHDIAQSINSGDLRIVR